MVVVIFFLTSIPCYATQSAARPVTYEQAKIQELVQELGLDVRDLHQLNEEMAGSGAGRMQSKSAPVSNRDAVLNEFTDVKAYLASIPYTSWTKETFSKAFEMTVNKLDEAKAKDYVEKLGISEKALSMIGSLTDLHSWLKDHPKTCALIIWFIVCVAVAIVILITGCFIGPFTIVPIIALLIAGIAAVIAAIIAGLVILICTENNSAGLPRACEELSLAPIVPTLNFDDVVTS
jgi:hypothetical protein